MEIGTVYFIGETVSIINTYTVILWWN